MKSLLSLYLILFFLSCSNEKPKSKIIFFGQMKLKDAPIERGIVRYYPTYQIDAENKVKEVITDKEGNFRIELDSLESYRFGFNHKGYVSTWYHYDFYKYGEYGIETSLDKLERQDDDSLFISTDMVKYFRDRYQMDKKGDIYSVTIDNIPDSVKKIAYKIKNKNGSLALADASIFDNTSSYLSEADVMDGKVQLEIDMTNYLTDKNHSSYKNLKNLEVRTGDHIFRDLVHKNGAYYYNLIKAKRKSEDFDKSGLEPLIELADELLASMKTRTDSIVLANHLYSAHWKTLDHIKPIAYAYYDSLASNPKRYAPMVRGSYYDYAYRAFKHLVNDEMPKAIKDSIEVAETIKAMDYIYSISPSASFRAELLSRRADYVQATEDMEAYKAALNQIINEYPQYYVARNAERKLQQFDMVGKQAPDFEYKNQDGQIVKLSDFKGKYVLLDFWGSWCSPCVEEFPNLRNIYAKIDKSKLEFIGACNDMKGWKLKEYIKEHRLTWTQLGIDSKLSAKYFISYWPTVFLIDPNGKIVMEGDDLRGENLENTLVFNIDGVMN